MLVAIAVFMSGGVVARSFWASAERHAPSPATTPARDFAVIPSPEGQAGRPSVSARPSPPSRHSHPRASAHRVPARAARSKTARPAAEAAVPAEAW